MSQQRDISGKLSEFQKFANANLRRLDFKLKDIECKVDFKNMYNYKCPSCYGNFQVNSYLINEK